MTDQDVMVYKLFKHYKPARLHEVSATEYTVMYVFHVAYRYYIYVVYQHSPSLSLCITLWHGAWRICRYSTDQINVECTHSWPPIACVTNIRAITDSIVAWYHERAKDCQRMFEQFIQHR